MKIVIETIPHEQHRYPAVGDYWVDKDGTIQVRVSKLSNWRMEVLIIIHELIELFLCRHEQISFKAIDRFDIAYEKVRKEGDESEPGDDPKAPYVSQHCIATGVERILCALFCISWKKYETELYKLP